MGTSTRHDPNFFPDPDNNDLSWSEDDRRRFVEQLDMRYPPDPSLDEDDEDDEGYQSAENDDWQNEADDSAIDYGSFDEV